MSSGLLFITTLISVSSKNISKTIFMKVSTAATINIDASLIWSLFSAKTNPAKDDNGTAKKEIVNIFPPSAIPKIFTAHAGNVEKWPPSHKNARQISIEYINAFSLNTNMNIDVKN